MQDTCDFEALNVLTTPNEHFAQRQALHFTLHDPESKRPRHMKHLKSCMHWLQDMLHVKLHKAQAAATWKSRDLISRQTCRTSNMSRMQIADACVTVFFSLLYFYFCFWSASWHAKQRWQPWSYDHLKPAPTCHERQRGHCQLSGWTLAARSLASFDTESFSSFSSSAFLFIASCAIQRNPNNYTDTLITALL